MGRLKFSETPLEKLDSSEEEGSFGQKFRNNS
jgi:hypothetical protein